MRATVNDTSCYVRNYEVSFNAESTLNENMILFTGVDSSGFEWIPCNSGNPQIQFDCYLSTQQGSPNLYSGEVNTNVQEWMQNEGISYINCDVFPDVPTARTEVLLHLDDIPPGFSGELQGGLFFEELNSYLPIGMTVDGPVVTNVPTTLECTAFIILMSEETLYYSQKLTTIESGLPVSLNLEPISESDLANLLRQL